ncbi:hypothetical protein QPK24_23270 [Paenibacillus polygoni]|uniref:Uncharacterized protein n=1 Tax=Paenibacillus polygoni TaxID=3050112 RepID=A0ABY8X2E8_9BACL|nr:hypothetical protein [Paenibacillus polygoni]WIV19198.1 hypothetical protein QPK24_23270 [Paenibacillus polygoni]
MDKYIIEISMSPDEVHILNPYFWCVLKLHETTWVNDGFGWSISPEDAWTEANKYYQNK